MVIYTSYFGHLRKLGAANITPIGIAIWKPKFYNGASLYNLAPLKFMLNDKLTWDEYNDLYRKEVLAKQKPYEVMKMINHHSQGRDVALLCYEKPGEPCHRHLAAQWLNENLGLSIKEFGEDENVEQKPQYVQTSLF